MNAAAQVLAIRPAKPEPLAQVEVLMLFSPALQGALPKGTVPVNSSQAWLSIDVFGKRGLSELTGRPTIEDMDLRHGDEDVNELLEPLADAIAAYVGSST